MPHYHYLCKVCEKRLTEAKGGPLSQEEELEAIFETSHAMEPTKAELRAAKKCPRCGSRRTLKTVNGIHVSGYVLGNGFLDREGVRRDMQLFHLTQKDSDTGKPLDPYGYLRQPGEADDLATRIKRSGKRGNNQKHYVASTKSTKDIERAVDAAVAKPPSTPETAK